jgi:hypothetical protein
MAPVEGDEMNRFCCDMNTDPDGLAARNAWPPHPFEDVRIHAGSDFCTYPLCESRQENWSECNCTGFADTEPAANDDAGRLFWLIYLALILVILWVIL